MQVPQKVIHFATASAKNINRCGSFLPEDFQRFLKVGPVLVGCTDELLLINLLIASVVGVEITRNKIQLLQGETSLLQIMKSPVRTRDQVIPFR